MFFLLYVPIVGKLLPPEAIDEMAAHVAEKIRQIGSNSEEATPEHWQELRRQLVEIIRAAQQQQMAIGGDGESDSYREEFAAYPYAIESIHGTETDTPPAAGSDAFMQLAPARDFLERCLKKSA